MKLEIEELTQEIGYRKEKLEKESADIEEVTEERSGLVADQDERKNRLKELQVHRDQEV